jgi:cell wall assembly regulator SMI1
MNQWLKFTEKYNNKFIGHYVYLNPPADEKAIQTLEEIIGTTLPQAFRDIYLVNNGQSLSSEDGCIFGL